MPQTDQGSATPRFHDWLSKHEFEVSQAQSMSYMLHPDVATPPDEIVIWRRVYMDLPKFLFMLEQKSLYFALLSEFEDKWEAVIDRQMTASIEQHFSAASGQVIELYQEFSKNIAVNCWYCGEGESVAMWRLYTNSEYGVAIRVSVKKTSTRSNVRLSEERVVCLDLIGTPSEYRDHSAPPSQVLAANQITALKAILQKRICYKHHRCVNYRRSPFLMPRFARGFGLAKVLGFGKRQAFATFPFAVQLVANRSA